MCGRLYSSKKHCILLGMQKITIKRLAKHADNQATDCTSAQLRSSVWAWLFVCVCLFLCWLCKNSHTYTHALTHAHIMHGLTQEAPHSSSSFIRLVLFLSTSLSLSLACCCSVWPKIFGINAINSLFSNGKLTAKRSNTSNSSSSSSSLTRGARRLMLLPKAAIPVVWSP